MKSEITLIEAHCGYHQHVYDRKIGLTFYCEPHIDRTSAHLYLNLYESVDATKRCSCIELDSIAFEDDNRLVHSTNTTQLTYHIHNTSCFNQIREMYSNLSR